MNPKQIQRIEGAILSALGYLQTHPAERSPGSPEEDEYGRVVSELRVSLALLRTWCSLARSTGRSEDTVTELPGQQHIPGVEPCEPKPK